MILHDSFPDANGAALLTESQGIWAQTQLRVFLASPFKPKVPATDTFKYNIWKVITSIWFEPIINVAIVVNVGSLMMEKVPSDPAMEPYLLYTNLVCLYIFTTDCILRAYALGQKAYLRDNWSKLDVFIVLSAWVSTVSTSLPPGFAVIRGLRVFRALMLLRKSKFLRPLLRTLVLSIPACANVFLLTVLWTFLYAILCMNLYGNLDAIDFNGCEEEGCINETDNFEDFVHSMTFLFQLISGQDYMELVHQLTIAEAEAPFLVIGSFVATIHWGCLNLFVVILVDMFIRCLMDSDVPISIEHMDEYQNLWHEGATDLFGEFAGDAFTEGPEHATIEIRKVLEFVPRLLPPTEILDSEIEEQTVWSVLGRFFGNELSISPLAELVPHRKKYPLPATPFQVNSHMAMLSTSHFSLPLLTGV